MACVEPDPSLVFKAQFVDSVFKPSPFWEHLRLERKRRVDYVMSKTGISEAEAAEFVDAMEALGA